MRDPAILPQLRAYVGFDEAAEERLVGIGPLLRGRFPRIVNEFYQAILADPQAKSVLQDDAQVERLRQSLMQWLETLVTGPYDEHYFESRARIGRVHVKVGLEQRFMLAAMNLIRIGLHRALYEESPVPPGAFEEHEAIDKICDIELAVILETYRDDYVLRKTAETESLAIMGRLTAGLAHEVRNPLNAAKLQLDVLRRNAENVSEQSLRERIQRRTNIVQDELRRLSMLLDDFLNLARARRMDPVRCDGCKLMGEVIELRRPEIESQGIELFDEIDEASCALLAERDRIKQVVNNLITNAVEAVTDVDKPRIEVRCRTTEDDHWEVDVVDNGVGISEELGKRAFDSFVTTKDAGTGLGLAIVKRIVELHGGGATLDPEPGGGTRASFWIPKDG